MSDEGPLLPPDRVREPLRAHLATRARHVAAEGSGTRSAVLVPLYALGGDTHLWLVRRASNMRSHGGQVAFPGGKLDPEDDSLVATALREANEEVGFTREDVDVLGPLDDLVTVTGYVVTPYVAWVKDTATPVPNPSEVARIFTAKLRRFMTSPTTPVGILDKLGYTIDGELVWGATAKIARTLGAIVRDLLRA